MEEEEEEVELVEEVINYPVINLKTLPFTCTRFGTLFWARKHSSITRYTHFGVNDSAELAYTRCTEIGGGVRRCNSVMRSGKGRHIVPYFLLSLDFLLQIASHCESKCLE